MVYCAVVVVLWFTVPCSVFAVGYILEDNTDESSNGGIQQPHTTAQ